MAFPSKPLTQLLGSNGISASPQLLPATNPHPRTHQRTHLLHPLLLNSLHPNRLLRPLHPSLQPLHHTQLPHRPPHHSNLHPTRLPDPLPNHLPLQQHLRLNIHLGPLHLPLGRQHGRRSPPLLLTSIVILRVRRAHQLRDLRRREW